jgi:SprT protein
LKIWRSLFASAPPVPPGLPVPAPPRPRDAELTGRAAALLREIGCAALAERVSVSWSGRLSSSAGLARPAAMSIVLNPRLREYPAEVDRTLRHELAHLVAYARAKRARIAAHGAEWRQACSELGVPGESRCHTLPLPRRSLTRLHLYRCSACGFILRRARRINLRRRPVACRECCRLHARGRYDSRFKFVEMERPILAMETMFSLAGREK